MIRETITMEMVCSDKPRPSVQKGAKGSQWWRRDVFHIRNRGAAKTMCGRLALGWLVIGKLEPTDLQNPDCCKKCQERAS